MARMTTAGRRIGDAATAVASALESLDGCELDAAKNALQLAVDDARDDGLTWGCIGDLLGIRRGAAIKRYYLRSQSNSPETAPV